MCLCSIHCMSFLTLKKYLVASWSRGKLILWELFWWQLILWELIWCKLILWELILWQVDLWELISWQVDLVRSDLVRIDFVRVHLMASWFCEIWSRENWFCESSSRGNRSHELIWWQLISWESCERKPFINCSLHYMEHFHAHLGVLTGIYKHFFTSFLAYTLIVKLYWLPCNV